MSMKNEKYTSKVAMKRHEKKEGPKERLKEYGKMAVTKKKPTRKMVKA